MRSRIVKETGSMSYLKKMPGDAEKSLVSFGSASRLRKRSAAWRTGDAATMLCGATHLCHRVLVRVEHSSRHVYVGR